MLTNQTDYTCRDAGDWTAPGCDVVFFELGEGYGYRIGGIYQPHDPDQPGATPMTWERAVDAAQALLVRLTPPPP